MQSSPNFMIIATSKGSHTISESPSSPVSHEFHDANHTLSIPNSVIQYDTITLLTQTQKVQHAVPMALQLTRLGLLR